MQYVIVTVCARLLLAYGGRVCATLAERLPEDESCVQTLFEHVLHSGLGFLWATVGEGWGAYTR